MFFKKLLLKYPLKNFHIGRVARRGASFNTVLLTDDKSGYYDIINRQRVSSLSVVNSMRYALPLSKYVSCEELGISNEDAATIESTAITLSKAKKLGEAHFNKFDEDYNNYLNSDEYKNSLDQDLQVPPVSIT